MIIPWKTPGELIKGVKFRLFHVQSPVDISNRSMFSRITTRFFLEHDAETKFSSIEILGDKNEPCYNRFRVIAIRVITGHHCTLSCLIGIKENL